MPDNQLTITLNLDDKASKEVQDALNKITGSTKDYEEKSKQTTNSVAEGFKSAGKSIREMRQVLLPVVATILSLKAVTDEWAKKNVETRDALELIGRSMKSLTQIVGSLFGPSIVGLSKLVEAATSTLGKMVEVLKQGWLSLLKTITYAIQFMVAFTTEISHGVNIVDAYKDALVAAGDAARDLGEQFQSAMTVNNTMTDEQQSKMQGLAEEWIRLSAEVSNARIMDDQRVMQENINTLNFYKENYMQAHAGIQSFTLMVAQTIKKGMSEALTGIIMGTMTAKQAFQQLGKMMIQAVVEFMVAKVVAFALEKTLMASSIAAAIAAGTAAGAALTAAYAPAALAANIASFGGAAVAAASTFPVAAGALTASMAVVSGMNQIAGAGGTYAGGYAEGTASVPGYAFGTDRAMAMVDAGEMIFPRSMADSIRSGDIVVGGRGSGVGGGGDIQINLYGVTINSKENVKELAEELGFEIDRKLRNARTTI